MPIISQNLKTTTTRELYMAATKSLISFDEKAIQEELGLQKGYNDADQALKAQADATVSHLLSINLNDFKDKENNVTAVETIGVDIEEQSGRRSGMLKQSIKTLAQAGSEGGVVSNGLVDLRKQVEYLDPDKVDFSISGIRKLTSLIPFIGSPVTDYFSRYESAGSVIDGIKISIENGQDQLKRDNITLSDDQEYQFNVLSKFKKAVLFTEMLDAGLTEKVNLELTSDNPMKAFIEEEVLFPLRQRTLYLQKRVAVSQQAVMTIELIKRNNKELINSGNTALSVTLSTLETAVSLALALNNQKLQMDRIDKLNTVSDKMMEATASKLKIQGVAIQKQAASSQLSVESLKRSFADINSAFEDISNFKREALPKMAANILELDDLSAQADATIQKMNNGKVAEKAYALGVF